MLAWCLLSPRMLPTPPHAHRWLCQSLECTISAVRVCMPHSYSALVCNLLHTLLHTVLLHTGYAARTPCGGGMQVCNRYATVCSMQVCSGMQYAAVFTPPLLRPRSLYCLIQQIQHDFSTAGSAAQSTGTTAYTMVRMVKWRLGRVTRGSHWVRLGQGHQDGH